MNRKNLEKVTCLLCEKELLYKNLNAHNASKHPGQPPKYRSAVSKDISSMLQILPTAKNNAAERETKDNCDDVISEPSKQINFYSDTSASNSEPPSKKIYLHSDTPASNSEPPSKQINLHSDNSTSNSLSQISEQLKDLTSEMKGLRHEIEDLKEGKTSAGPVTASANSKSSNSDLVEQDERILLITYSRSLRSILKFLDNWTLSEDGLKCVTCGIIVKYDHLSEGTDFDKDDILPRSFCNFKKGIIRHLQGDSHIKSLNSFQNAQAREKELLDVGKQCGINCASAAYTCIYFAESKQSYEHHIVDIYSSGGLVGTKNHSKNFPSLFLPHIYDVVRSNVSNYVTSNILPFGLIADKMTTKHLTRHMVGIRVPIWDIRYPFLAKDIYVQCSCINDVTGKGIASHLIETLESFGIDRIYQRENLAGCAMDGQYIKLNIHYHLSDIFFREYHVTWDPAHRIELAMKDSNQNFIESTSDTIHSVMKYLSCGKPYLELLDQK